ncbi:MAG: type II toxin-antitoxin system RelE/ParE family toxin [Planctomycetes bacterium]|nr:type II toxin-antitoxin system RelE/ParE family toxin [Planctomycetota bacterium]
MTFRIRAGAQRYLAEIREWYDAEFSGLGDEFLSAFAQTTSHIRTFPRAGRIVYREYRCAKVRRFPYLVFYIADAESVVIVAVIHQHRDPDVWKDRVR